MAKHEAAASGGRTWVNWTVSWVGTVGIRAANRRLTRATVGRKVSDLRAHQLSTAGHMVTLGQRFVHLQRTHPIRRPGTALAIGASWVALTVGFDYALGRFVSHKSWDELVRDYDVRTGRIWPLALLVMLIGPEVARRLAPAEDETAS